jgi:hypothetical protein
MRTDPDLRGFFEVSERTVIEKNSPAFKTTRSFAGGSFEGWDCLQFRRGL